MTRRSSKVLARLVAEPPPRTRKTEGRSPPLCSGSLSEIFGMAWYEIHEEAEWLERDRKLLEFFEKEGIRPGAHLIIEA